MMVDKILPIERTERKLRYLFFDLNSYFASVEQQENPDLRGRPVAVCPVMADSSFVIAASYPAKAYGVKTGTRIGDAKQMCPDLTLVHANPAKYVKYHQRILEVAESVLPIDKVCSIDEMRFKLIGEECEPEQALLLAKKMQRQLAEHVGECMTASVGVAPNAFLAKVASDMQKPSGLVILTKDDLPDRLFELKLTDFAGINKRMAARLNAAGMFTSAQMCRASKAELFAAFGSVIGERWWYLLRGFDLQLPETERKSLSHSHVLAPVLRTDQGCREVLMRLVQKASARLRQNDLWAQTMSVFVKGFGKSWEGKGKFSATQDTLVFNDSLLKLWQTRDFVRPRSVGVVFSDLALKEQTTPSLFDEEQDHTELNSAVDQMNQKFGKNTIYLAGMQRAKDSADEKIAFNKTWLFKEGKDDHEWPDTFRGLITSDRMPSYYVQELETLGIEKDADGDFFEESLD